MVIDYYVQGWWPGKLICTRNIFLKVMVYGEEYAVGAFHLAVLRFFTGGEGVSSLQLT